MRIASSRNRISSAGDAAHAVPRGNERLGDDALKRVGELHPHLRLLLGGEDVDDAVDRAGRALRVQRPEDEVTGLGGGQRGRDGLEVSHLAEEDHVRVLTERSAERVGESRRVLADLALVDDAALVIVEELDRILDRDDVIGAAAVDLVDDRREGRRLTGAGRPGDEHETAGILGQLVEALGQAELLERLDHRRDRAERGREAAALIEGVDAEAGDAADAVGEVELPAELQVLLLLGRRDAVDQLAQHDPGRAPGTRGAPRCDRGGGRQAGSRP